MISSITIDDQSGVPVTLHSLTGKRQVTTASGLIGMAPLRDSRRVRPQAHGGIDDTRYQDGRVISLDAEIMSNVSREDAFAEFRLVTAPLVAMLDGGSPTLLRWTEGDSGLQLQRYVKVASAVDPTIQEAAALLRFQVQFYAEDPLAYSQTLTTATGTALTATGGGRTYPMIYNWFYADAGAGTTIFTNAGNASTRPLLRLYGALTNPGVMLGTRRISLLGTIAAGEYVEIDLSAPRTITRVSGGIRSDARNMLDPVGTQWFSLPANTVSSLRLVASAFDGSARLDVVGRSAYV